MHYLNYVKGYCKMAVASTSSAAVFFNIDRKRLVKHQPCNMPNK